MPTTILVSVSPVAYFGYYKFQQRGYYIYDCQSFTLTLNCLTPAKVLACALLELWLKSKAVRADQMFIESELKIITNIYK